MALVFVGKFRESVTKIQKNHKKRQKLQKHYCKIEKYGVKFISLHYSVRKEQGMRNLKKGTAIALAALMAAMSLTGCGGNKQTETGGQNAAQTTAAANEAAAEKTGDSILQVHLPNEVSTMDAQLATDGWSFEVISSVTEGLYRLDANGSPVLGVAESVEKSEDGLTYTFKIREDAKWSNGDPVTADDFVFAWRRAVDPETASEYAFIVDAACIANAGAVSKGELPLEELGVKAVDSKTLEVTLDKVCAYFESLMAFCTFMPLNQAFYESCGASYATSPDTILANGAFKISDYEPAATTISAVKNDAYYAASDVTLDGLTWKVIKDAQQAVLAYQSGELNLVTLSGEQVELYEDDPCFQNVMEGYLWFVSPNLHVTGQENLNIRKAMAMAFNKEAIAKNVLKNGSVAADYMVPTSFATGPDGTDFRDNGATYLSYDPEKALEYWNKGLEELGVTSLSYKLDVQEEESCLNVAQFLQEQWQTNLPGLTIEINSMPKKQAAANKRAGEFELTITRWGPDYADPMSYLEMWISGASNNYADWSNAEYDELIDFCKTTTDMNKRWETMKEAEAIAAEGVVIMPVYQAGSAVMISEGVENVQFHSVGVSRVYRDVTMQ